MWTCGSMLEKRDIPESNSLITGKSTGLGRRKSSTAKKKNAKRSRARQERVTSDISPFFFHNTRVSI